MGYSFFVDSQVTDNVNTWLFENLSLPLNFAGDRVIHRRFNWFPHYNIRGSSAIRVDLRENDDALIFKLAWGSHILAEKDYS